MVILEALNALYGDCLLLRYDGPDQKERLWIIDGGPKAGKTGDEKIAVWKDVLLPRLKEISSAVPIPVALGMVSEVDVDREAAGRQRARVDPAVEPPQQQVRVQFVGFGFAEHPACTPRRETEDDWFEITARGREPIAAIVILSDDVGSFQLLESSTEQGAGQPGVAADELVEPRRTRE